jgi:hypothetical protein
MYDANSTSQSSRRSEKSGRQRRRRRKPRARPTKSDTAPTFSSVPMRVVPPKLLSTDRCDKLSVSPDSLLNTLNFLPSGTNLPPPATQLLLSMARRVRVFLRAWRSMPPPTAMHTTVPIVTAAVTLNRRTDRTRRCTSRTISQVSLAVKKNLAPRGQPLTKEIQEAPRLFPSLLPCYFPPRRC